MSDEAGDREVDEEVVLGGEDLGEEEAPPADPFHISKEAAAVFKHGVLTRYLQPFVAKVGSTSTGGVVALLDGYAGPGRYRDGAAGSPALMAATAKDVTYRQLECHLVERKRKTFKELEAFLRAEGADLNATAYRGRLQEHLDDILSATEGKPLLAFLDPFGFGIPFDDVVRILTRYRNRHEPATEVLLNFTANGVRRVGGLLRKGRAERLSRQQELTVEGVDVSCGGDWWRDVVLSHEILEEAVEAVAEEYMMRVAAAARMGGFTTPVRKREHHKPVYYLTFFTRHPDGLWLFHEAVSGAAAEWRKHLAPPPASPQQDTLFEIAAPSFEDEEKARAVEWHQQLRDNLLREIAKGQPFTVGERLDAVFGEALGLARGTHLRKAIKELHKEGRTATEGKGDLQKMTILPPAT